MAISTAVTTVELKRTGDDTTDGDLVALVRGGDDRAFEQLYLRYHRRISAYIDGMVRDHARSEDITQDVFMSALRRMRQTDRPIAFKPWIYEIAKNACIDQFRRSRRAEEVSFDADDAVGSADYGKLATREATPEVAVAQKQQLDDLCGAFGGLSETHHEILVMRELEGLSYREIGERLGMTRPAVESTLFRARRRLTEEYDELVTGERCRRVQSIIAAATEGALGTRDHRKVSRHVSYCRPCLRQARVAGMDTAALVHRPLRQKIAALLPIPAFFKNLFPQLSQQAAVIDPGAASSWGKAAVTAATIALAGVGAGVATDPSGPGGSSLLGPRPGDATESSVAAGTAPAARTTGPAIAGGGSAAAGTPARDEGPSGGRTQARTPASSGPGEAVADGGSSAAGGGGAATGTSSGARLPAVPGGPDAPVSNEPDVSVKPKVGLPAVTLPDIGARDEPPPATDPGKVVDDVEGTVNGVTDAAEGAAGAVGDAVTGAVGGQ